MSKLLNGRTAIVSGAGSGIGRAVAETFAREGANVVVSDISEPAGNETVAMLKKAGGQAIFVKADTSSASDNESLVARAVQEYGGLHVAVNNAGIGGAAAPVGEYPIDSWDKVIGVNLSGVFYGMRYQIPAIPHFSRHHRRISLQRRGDIRLPGDASVGRIVHARDHHGARPLDRDAIDHAGAGSAHGAREAAPRYRDTRRRRSARGRSDLDSHASRSGPRWPTRCVRSRAMRSTHCMRVASKS